MASESGSQRNSQLRIDPPRPRYRASPYPLFRPTPDRNPPIGHGSSSIEGNSSRSIAPTQNTTSDPLHAKLTSLRGVLEEAKTGFSKMPPVRSAVDELKDCVECIQIKEQYRNEYEKLISQLINLIPLLWRPFVQSAPQVVPQEISDAAESIEANTKAIKDVEEPSQGITEENREKTTLERYMKLCKQFENLQTKISAWEKRRESWTDAHRKDLLPTHESYYNAALPTTVTKRVGCTENTRVDLLNDLWIWSRAPSAAKIYWLNGMAGTGKTTIAYTICKRLQEDGRLAASFFCSRNVLECRDVNKLVPTIAYQLGQPGLYSNSYRHRLCNAFEQDTDIARRDISIQFEELIAKPLSTMGDAMPNNMVVVIDALDECTDVHGAEVVLNMLLKHAESLPIKFFVTSRPEPAIIQRMTTGDGSMRSILWLHDIEQSLVQADIRTYLAEALRSVQVTPAELDALASRAGCLFIFAATAVQYILPSRGSVSHRQRLQAVLKLRPRQGNKSYKDIDDLYTTILSNALDSDEFEEHELVIRRQVLWTVACASGPLTILGIAGLLNLPGAEAVEVAVQPLQSVLRISETTNMVSTLHASFPDFLLSEERAGPFFCNEVLQNAYLAERCFRIMDQSLQFNICRLESSYVLDQNVPDLQERVDRVISAELFYACKYWGDHLAKCPSSPLLMDLLDNFMQKHFLFWVEVLNLKKHVGHGDGVLGQALVWLSPVVYSTGLQRHMHDARAFLIIFASSPTSLSTPHIYISSLPFTPKQSRVWRTYWPQTQGLIRVESKAIDKGGKSALATWNVGAAVTSIIRSSDGKRIASVSGPKSRFMGSAYVSIRDAFSGIRIGGLIERHAGPILSVAFSPDETRLAIASADCNIRIWDPSNNQLLAGPLHGHTGDVNSVSFSPNGACLASGSVDRTIRVWDAFSGAQLCNPLSGHRGSVTSVAFSPGGKYLASGSVDHSVRVWDLQKRTPAHLSFEAHTQSVNAIAYSPDALYLVSGSEDQTIRVWDVSTGASLVGLLIGHSGAITSVSFSPNSRLVVSGSQDKTVRVWKAWPWELLAGPFGGHSDQVNSVLFAVDGTRILSGSDDGTIRVWDARHKLQGPTESLGHTGGIHSVVLSPDGFRVASGLSNSTVCIRDSRNGALVAGPFRGHTRSVRSVAFSPDGARIASGSADHTLRIWDALTGTLLADPFKGHTDLVAAVTFSPDGNRVASGSHDRTIRIWNSHTGEAVSKPFKGHREPVTSLAFSLEGTRLVSGSWDCAVRMWRDHDRTMPLWTSFAHSRDVNCVAFSFNGMQVVSGSDDCTIWVLDASDGAALRGPFTGHIGWISSVSFSPDGTQIVSASEDGTVRVWHVASGTTVAGPLKGQTGEVKSAIFSPDGTHVISGSADGTIRWWDLAAATKPGATLHHDFSIDHDGWLTNSSSQKLIWVPPDLRNDFKLPSHCNPFVINLQCSSFIDGSALYFGDQWHKCYRPSLLSIG